MDSILITADRLWDSTGTAAMLRPLVRVSAGLALGRSSNQARVTYSFNGWPGIKS